MRYLYFVSYVHSNEETGFDFGNILIYTSKRINKNLIDIAEVIKKEINAPDKNIVILNYIITSLRASFCH
jgi:hypothetical protein